MHWQGLERPQLGRLPGTALEAGNYKVIAKHGAELGHWKF
jgi:hypothetical protein